MRASFWAYLCAIFSERSVLQLLTIMYSQFWYVWANTLSIHSAKYFSPLYTGVTTLTRGCVCKFILWPRLLPMGLHGSHRNKHFIVTVVVVQLLLTQFRRY